MAVTVNTTLAGPLTARFSNIYGALANLGLVSSLGAQDVTGSGDPVAPILNASEFYAPLTHSLILTRGTGDPTYSRATKAWEFDNEGKLILVPSGAARFGGARMVYNQIGAPSQDFTSASWGKSGGGGVTVTGDATTAPDGTNTADKIIPNAGTAQHYVSVSNKGSWAAGSIISNSVYAKYAGLKYLIVYNASAPSAGAVWFDLQNGVVGSNQNGLVGTIEAVGDGWYRCKVIGTATSISTSVEYHACTTDGSFNGVGDGVSGIYLWGPQLENVTGQADQTASEYVSVGVLSAPYHGAGVDGIKYFNTNKDGSDISASSLLGYHSEGARTNSLLYSRDLRSLAGVSSANVRWTSTASVGAEVCGDPTLDNSGYWGKTAGVTVASGQATIISLSGEYQALTKTGLITVGKTYLIEIVVSSISGSIAVAVGGNPLEYTISATGTHIVPTTPLTTGTLEIKRSSGACNAVLDSISVKEAAIQVTTCTGLDNAANSASTLTAGAADATILQTLTLAAAARSFSAYVKRRTGTGNVYITRDGGTNWTDVTSQINSSTWTRVKIENTSVLNPSCGFKIATSGDAIDVDVCQDEAGAYASSPIVTTTAAVTRNTDSLAYAITGNIDNTVGSFAITSKIDVVNASDKYIFSSSAGARLWYPSGVSPFNDRVRFGDGTTANPTVTGVTGSATNKISGSWGGAAKQLCVNGSAVQTASFDGNWLDSSGTITLGSIMNGYFKGCYFWSTALTDAQLQQVTA